jgi:hypothetical protein
MASLFECSKWRESFLAAQRNVVPVSGHALVAEIEASLDPESAAVPDKLETLFQACDLTASTPPKAMISYLERLFESPNGERRRTQRASLLATIQAIPLTADLEPCGDPFKAAARDASEGGISLLHTRAVTSAQLALRWQSLGLPARQINILLRVDRCQPQGPFYEIAGQFVSWT